MTSAAFVILRSVFPQSVFRRLLWWLAAIMALAAPATLVAPAAAQASAPVPLQGLSPREAEADLVWKLRAGLNVAALQCQFSPFLATVPVYNAFLRQHSDELAQSFRTMVQYFIRQNGPRVGQRAFDTYATRANQSWATFDAKMTFCNTAALIGRRALAVPKGQFAEFAASEVPVLRQSLELSGIPEALGLDLQWARVPDITSCRIGRRCSF